MGKTIIQIPYLILTLGLGFGLFMIGLTSASNADFSERTCDAVIGRSAWSGVDDTKPRFLSTDSCLSMIAFSTCKRVQYYRKVTMLSHTSHNTDIESILYDYIEFHKCTLPELPPHIPCPPEHCQDEHIFHLLAYTGQLPFGSVVRHHSGFQMLREVPRAPSFDS